MRSCEGSAPARHYVAKHRALECPRGAVAEKGADRRFRATEICLSVQKVLAVNCDKANI
jgi:hypothetical protein